MEGRDVRPGATGAPALRPDRTVYDRHWAAELHSAVRWALALLAALFLLDWGSGDGTAWRAVLWCGLSALLFVLLCPRRVSAGKGWLASRGPLGTHRVRTDLLVSVRFLDGVARRLVLRDALGGRVELDPQVLTDNPGLWYRLSEDARKSADGGTLLCGAGALHRVQERIDRETALAVFKVSGMR